MKVGEWLLCLPYFALQPNCRRLVVGTGVVDSRILRGKVKEETRSVVTPSTAHDMTPIRRAAYVKKIKAAA